MVFTTYSISNGMVCLTDRLCGVSRLSERASETAEAARAEAVAEGAAKGHLVGVLAFGCFPCLGTGSGNGVSVGGAVQPDGVPALGYAVEPCADAYADTVVADAVGAGACEVAALDGEILRDVLLVAPAGVAAELPHLAHEVHHGVVVSADDGLALLAELIVAYGVVHGVHVYRGVREEALVDAGGHGLCRGSESHEAEHEGEGCFSHSDCLNKIAVA